MKRFKKYIFIGAASLLSASCSDFLDTTPLDALTPSTTWQTENDAQKFAIGCYNEWASGKNLLYMDCTSDFGYNNFPWEHFKDLGNGSMTPASNVQDFYNYTTIRRCNTFLDNVDKITFKDESVKKDLVGQVRFIRAFRYFVMNYLYGGVAIIDCYDSAQEAQVPRKSEAEVRQFIHDELDTAIADLKDAPSERGRIAKGAALALRMREALYYDEWEVARANAQKIIDLNLYELEPNYLKLFQVAGQSSKEIILALQYIPGTYILSLIGQMYNNGEGGWSSIVPTYNLVNLYEMLNGKTIDEEGSGYDPVHPFKGRDPRMAMTIIYPGANHVRKGGEVAIYNSLDMKLADGSSNPNFMTSASNASKTGLTWNKYLSPVTQYDDPWAANTCPIVFRYAEVLLTWAEAENELNGPSAEIYKKLNMIRNRVGMPNVDEAKYATKEALRELIHRERGVEFAGEGIRRPDILRWKTEDGKMLAEKVLNQVLERKVGTVSNDPNMDPELRATINVNAPAADLNVEKRTFKPFHRYFPFLQKVIDKNPNLTQNAGY